MAARVARQEDDVAPGQLAGEQFVGRRTERCSDLHPFLPGEPFDVIEAAASDDADPGYLHESVQAPLWAGPAVQIRPSVARRIGPFVPLQFGSAPATWRSNNGGSPRRSAQTRCPARR